jgi:solute carrier family 25 carnitine/acylcarnitine transporter 20/29
MLTGAVRDSIGTGIYFVTYESVKQVLANARGTSPTHPLAVVVAGGLCGLVSWACVCYSKYGQGNMLTEPDIPYRHCKEHLPAQLSRRRQGETEQAQDPVPEPSHVSRYDAHNIARDLQPLTRPGLGVSMSRSCVVNAIFFTAFEFTKKRINGMTVDEELLREHEANSH